METVEEKVKDIIERLLGILSEDIKMDHKLQKDMGTDSLDEIEILMELEKIFAITISDEEAESLVKGGDILVKDIIEYVTGKLQAERV